MCWLSFPLMSTDKKYFACFDSYITNFNTNTNKIMECSDWTKWRMIVNDNWRQTYFECQTWEIILKENSSFDFLESITFHEWNLPKLSDEEINSWSCHMFTNEYNFIYYSNWSYFWFDFHFPQSDIPILWQISYWIEQFTWLLTAPLNSV